MASSSSSQLEYHVFLSFRGEDTRLSFTSHLLKALNETGINVFFDETELKKGEQLSLALSRASAASNLSIIVLSMDYASSKSCLSELSDIMEHKHTRQHIVLPIFYHVDPSHVRHIGGSFKASFEDHESNRLFDEVKRWKAAFVEIGQLKGWHINGDKTDRSDADYIREIVQYVIEKLNCKSKSISEGVVGINDQKKMVLNLIEKEDTRVIGLWGMGGTGKTTLADVVYHEISQKFKSCYFLGNVREKIEKQGKESVRNEVLSKLLNSKTCINTLSIGSNFTRQRLTNMKVIVVFDDVSDSYQIDHMGVEYFGAGSKIIVTSRDRQVLNNAGANKIHEMKMLEENDSLQLFSTFAFKHLNPPPDFRDLSYMFLRYAQGNPLALIALGSKLYTKDRKVWVDEGDKLGEIPHPKLVHILRRSFDELDDSDKNIFLDIACFLKGEPNSFVEEILSCLYKGVVSGISNLLDKCLLHMDSYGRISMHDMLEEMGKDIVHQGLTDPRKRSRLWTLKDVNQVLSYNKVNISIQGIKLVTTRIRDMVLLCPNFGNILNLRYLHLRIGYLSENEKQLVSVSLPNELKYLCWMFYPFKSMPSSFSPKNLVVLKLQFGYMEYLWNEDDQDLDNLREIDVCFCKKLKKIPNLSRAINLQSLVCTGCESLVELPKLNLLTSLKKLEFEGCHKLEKFPELPNNFSELDLSHTGLDLSHTGIETVPDSIQHLVGRELILRYSKVEHVSGNISRLESLGELDLFHCKSLKTLSKLPRYLRWLDVDECLSLEQVSFTDLDSNCSLHDGDGDGDDDAPDPEYVSMSFSNCRSLNQDSIKNIETNAMLRIRSLAPRWARRKGIAEESCSRKQLLCCFSGKEVSAHEFEHRSVNSWLSLKITPNGSRFLAFAICVVVDLTRVNRYLEFICKYRLTAAGGEKLQSECRLCYISKEMYRYKGEHVLIMFNEDMIIINNDYEEASFELYIRNHFIGEETQVEKWGVRVFHVDAQNYDHSATTAKRFSHVDGEEGSGWPKRFGRFQFLNHWVMLLRRCIGKFPT
ncbi:disease resistance protein RUN1-like [Hibiscus syriacus]|uniref:disease resistance protein RUN1-like n=1 Tax=Hibiscus syriacus TaxID=106335 RepID=UPI001921DD7B|nr:disease resistance protein RUN1-like [Hibiscus syriacus]